MFAELPAQRGLGERFAQLDMQPIDDCARRCGGRDQHEPAGRIELGQPEIGERRDFGQRPNPLACRKADRP